MKIGDVARALNIPSSTIRYYEKRGLIPPPNRVSGKREFDKSTMATLRFIQLCQTAGFTISEIDDLIRQYSDDASEPGICQPAVVSKREQVQKQIDELKRVDVMLGEMMKCRCKSIEQCLSFALEH